MATPRQLFDPGLPEGRRKQPSLVLPLGDDCFALYLLDGVTDLPAVEEMADDLQIGQWHQEMMAFIGIDKMSGAEVRAATIELASRDWHYRPVRIAGTPRDILRAKPRPARPRARRII